MTVKYQCPICGDQITENLEDGALAKMKRRSHKCPSCGGRLYMSDKGTFVDLGEMLVRALELGTGIILSKEEALSHYYEV